MPKIQFEIDGVIYGNSSFSSEEFDASEGVGEEVDIDPEAWRQYADVIDAAQIEWLKKHPEHDHSGVLEHVLNP